MLLDAVINLNIQERVHRMMLNVQYVQVDLVPEPENPQDSKAIAFKCKVDGKVVCNRICS